MNLIDELENDLAYAFLVEKRLSNKIESREALDLIGRVKAALQIDIDDPSEKGRLKDVEKISNALSH